MSYTPHAQPSILNFTPRDSDSEGTHTPVRLARRLRGGITSYVPDLYRKTLTLKTLKP